MISDYIFVLREKIRGHPFTPIKYFCGHICCEEDILFQYNLSCWYQTTLFHHTCALRGKTVWSFCSHHSSLLRKEQKIIKILLIDRCIQNKQKIIKIFLKARCIQNKLKFHQNTPGRQLYQKLWMTTEFLDIIDW